ncbi:MAG: sugar ABC transporter permease [Oscillospiraceae bacterium]|nr:sugar ABC transporter permease [Oscillospiraceae bacterium]
MSNTIKKIRFDAALLFLAPGFVGFFIFYIWPFIISIGYSLVDKPVGGSFVGLKNYLDLLGNEPYLIGFKNMLVFIGMSVPVGIALALAVAMLVDRAGKHRRLFALIFLIPLVIPTGSTVFFWKALFNNDGYINFILTFFGISPVRWLDTDAVRYVISLIFIWKNLGYSMVLFLAGLHSIPKEYYEAAAVDGANAVYVFFKITLPGLLTTFVLVIIMSIINSFKVFKEIYLITGSYPHQSIYTLQHFMNNMFFSLNYQRLTTATCILVLVIGALVSFLFRFEKRALR